MLTSALNRYLRACDDDADDDDDAGHPDESGDIGEDEADTEDEYIDDTGDFDESEAFDEERRSLIDPRLMQSSSASGRARTGESSAMTLDQEALEHPSAEQVQSHSSSPASASRPRDLQRAEQALLEAWNKVTNLPSMPIPFIAVRIVEMLNTSSRSANINITTDHPFDEICGGDFEKILKWARNFPLVCTTCLDPLHRSEVAPPVKTKGLGKVKESTRTTLPTKTERARASLMCTRKDPTKTRCCLCFKEKRLDRIEVHATRCLDATLAKHGNQVKTMENFCTVSSPFEGVVGFLCPFTTCIDPGLRNQRKKNIKGDSAVATLLRPKRNWKMPISGYGIVPLFGEVAKLQTHMASHVFDQPVDGPCTVRYQTSECDETGAHLLKCAVSGCEWTHQDINRPGQLCYIAHLVNGHKLGILRTSAKQSADSVEVDDFAGKVPHYDPARTSGKVFAVCGITAAGKIQVAQRAKRKGPTLEKGKKSKAGPSRLPAGDETPSEDSASEEV